GPARPAGPVQRPVHGPPGPPVLPPPRRGPMNVLYLTNNPNLGSTARILQSWLLLGRRDGLTGRVVAQPPRGFTPWLGGRGSDYRLDPGRGRGRPRASAEPVARRPPGPVGRPGRDGRHPLQRAQCLPVRPLAAVAPPPATRLPRPVPRRPGVLHLGVRRAAAA